MQSPAGSEKFVPTIYRFWIPVVAVAVVVLLGQIGYPLDVEFAREALKWLESEEGALELGTVVVLAIAMYHGGGAILPARRRGMSLLAIWIALNTLAVFYFFGEELSWGQHLIGWGTPEWIAAHNDQNETNLHNMSSWLDQKPRLLVYIGIAVGGIVVPLYRRRNPGARWVAGPFWGWVWPTMDGLTTAILVSLIRIPEKTLQALRIPDDAPIQAYLHNFRSSEVQEFLIACFFLIYLYAIRRRLRDAAAAS